MSAPLTCNRALRTIWNPNGRTMVYAPPIRCELPKGHQGLHKSTADHATWADTYCAEEKVA